MPIEQIILSRECDATLIPSGTKVKLADGTTLAITHRLGGNFTVSGAFGMARVAGIDADALGEPIVATVVRMPSNVQNISSGESLEVLKNDAQDEVQSNVQNLSLKSSENSQGQNSSVAISKEKFEAPEESELWEIAKTVYDPEIPLNIVDLGLVYRLDVITSPEGRHCVEADMTLTAPGCAMGPIIADDLKMRLQALPGVDDAQVNIVWDPPWHQDMITEEGKMTLGLL